jgi:hypothetical protein
MKKSIRVAILAAVVCVTTVPMFAAPMGTNPHPNAGVSLGTIVSAVLSALGL